MSKAKVTFWSVDKRRVALFKAKLRALLDGLEKPRFERSVGGTALIINLRLYKSRSTALKYVAEKLKSGGVSYEAKEMWAGTTLANGSPDYISIPLDQEALPERVRRYGFKGDGKERL